MIEIYSSYLIGILALPPLILMILVGYYLFTPAEIRSRWKHISRRKLVYGIVPYVFSALFVYALVKSQSFIMNTMDMENSGNYASYIMLVEGDAVSYFQLFMTPLLTYVNSFVYLLIFAFLLIFTFMIFVVSCNLKGLQEFTISFILIYIVAFPFYIFFPVTVTGYTLNNMNPLLYSLHPLISTGLRFCDPYLDNCFPSLHAALSIMVLIIVLYRCDIKRYRTFVLLATIAVQFSILYLGIHWITDLISGVILALITCAISIRYREKLLKIPQKLVVPIEEYLGVYDTTTCRTCARKFNIPPHSGKVKCPSCGSIQPYHPLKHLCERD